MVAVIFDPTDEAVIVDPYPLYRRLRENEPVHRSAHGDWVITRHCDVVAVLRDDRFGRLPPGSIPHAPEDAGPAVAAAFRMFLSLDPPDHTRLRRLLSDVFKPSALASLQASMDVASAGLVGDALRARTIEVVSNIAIPLPSTVIGDLLGVPLADRPRLVELATRFSEFDPDLRPLTHDQETEVVGLFHEIAAFAAVMVTERSDAITSDVLRSIRVALDNGDASLAEATATFALLFMAGHDTTISLLANGLHALAQRPEQWALLRSDLDLVPAAVEELLRFDSPVQVATRFAQQDVRLHDTDISAGDRVVLGLASANRDPDVFDDPDTLDIRRRPSRHLAFGHGIHFCLGAHLARMEAVSLFTHLARSAKTLTLTEPVEWRRTLGARSVSRLVVELS